jgi:hypothetical protein
MFCNSKNLQTGILLIFLWGLNSQARMADRKSKNKKKNQEMERETPEKTLQKLMEEARIKSEAYKKILKSLNTNKNED